MPPVPPHTKPALLSTTPFARRWLLALVSLGMAFPAGAADKQDTIVAPATETTLHFCLPLPRTAAARAAQVCRLVEAGHESEAFPAQWLPATTPDGTVDGQAVRLAASIAPRAGATGQRAFRIESPRPATPAAARSDFRFEAITDQSLGLWEGQRPVWVYNHGVISRAGVPSDRARSTYLHPLYGLAGEVLTDDFPADHHHHRGLFWAWPHVKIGELEYDLWMLKGVQHRFERWLARDAGPTAAALGVENGWYVGERKVVQERAWFYVYQAANGEQPVDVELTWIPLEQPLTLAGAEGKSYGGLTLRFAPRTNTVITTTLGRDNQDLPMTRLPWADLTARFAGAPGPSGAAVFIAPDHPDYPPEWLTRHYGVLCVGWPGIKAQTFAPGQRILCRYRVWVHRGAPDPRALANAYEAYSAAFKARAR